MASSEDYSGALGLIVVSDQAVAAGVASVPNPATDSGSDWFVYEPIAGHLVVGTAVGLHLNMESRVTDSRAMRKIGDGQDIVFVVENSLISLGAIYTTFQRLLIKLH